MPLIQRRPTPPVVTAARAVLALLLAAWLAQSAAVAQQPNLMLTLAPREPQALDRGQRAVEVVGAGFTPNQAYIVRYKHEYTQNMELVKDPPVDQKLKADAQGAFTWIDEARKCADYGETFTYQILYPDRPDQPIAEAMIAFNSAGNVTTNTHPVPDSRPKSAATVLMVFGLAFITFAVMQVLVTKKTELLREEDFAESKSNGEQALEKAEKGRKAVDDEHLGRLELRWTATSKAAGGNVEKRGEFVKGCDALQLETLSCAGQAEALHTVFSRLPSWWASHGAAVARRVHGHALEVHCAKLTKSLDEARQQSRELEESFAVCERYPGLQLPRLDAEAPQPATAEPDSIAAAQRATFALAERNNQLMDHVRSSWLPGLDKLLDEAQTGAEPVYQFLTDAQFTVLAPQKGELSQGLYHEEMAQGPPDGVDAGQVIRLMKRGYVWHKTVLRKAQIVVATAR